MGLDFNPNLKFGGHKKYSLSEEDVRNICMVFVMSMLPDASMYYPKNLTKADKEFYTFNGIEFSYLRDNHGDYIKSFIPIMDHMTNKRLEYLTKVLKKNNKDITKEESKKLLGEFWDAFFAPNRENRAQIMFKDNEGHYKVNVSNLVISKNKKVYCCKKCNKLTFYNVRNVCPSFHCDGELEEIDVETKFRDNHYFNLYHNLLIEPLRVVEHTAQLDKEEAYNYQNLFKDQKIDVLSCSTTFEMGVDVGDLETVFMRNMPPSASNYAQRAGRAGRSIKSAAFALTFCNKSNHDFNYFDNPIQMINGIIEPPHFKIDNEKICIRHLYSSSLSFFFKLHPQFFSTAKRLLEIDNETNTSGYIELEKFLRNDSKERDKLKDYLYDSIPLSLHEKFELNDFGWVNFLFGKNNIEYPSLFDVKEHYLNELNALRDAYIKAKNEGNVIQYALKNRIKTYEEERIISFLSRNNILPRYGFPVDTVDLEINTNTKDNDLSGLELTRDLSMAISEYAPGCEVVANNRLVRSEYIKKNPGFDLRKYDFVECPNCKTLNVIPSVGNLDENKLCRCKQCNIKIDSKKIKTFLIPEFGFIASEKIEKPSLIKPEKTYRTEATFFSYKDTIDETKYNVMNKEVIVSQISNDGEMCILNTTDFFVCPYCGYAKEKIDKIGPYVKFLVEKNHKDPHGYACKKDVNLERYSLGYKFKTDVIRIKIKSPLLCEGKKYDEAYTILQALILGASRVLNIEASEIAGCLQYYKENDKDNYSYILYDTTAGGAGHVKRLNDKDMISRLLNKAYEITNGCPSCDKDSSCYSCLRTYHNQKYHDIIKRSYKLFKKINF